MGYDFFFILYRAIYELSTQFFFSNWYTEISFYYIVIVAIIKAMQAQMLQWPMLWGHLDNLGEDCSNILLLSLN